VIIDGYHAISAGKIPADQNQRSSKKAPKFVLIVMTY